MSSRPAMSIIIPTFQRRDSLIRLLDSLGEAIDDPTETEVIVVVDGSRDGTVEALTNLAHETSFPLRWHVQPNRGRSMARNVGIAVAKGDVCWLLDDDMTVEPGSLVAHRAFHESTATPTVLVGATSEGGPDPHATGWTTKRTNRLGEDGWITDPAEFWTGNFSVPRSALLEIGGFNADFVGWGEEDVELGYRFHKHGIRIRFEPAAATRHDRVRPPDVEIQEQRQRGRNLVLLSKLHPEALHRNPVSFPTPRLLAALYARGLRSAIWYRTVAELSTLLLRFPGLGSKERRHRLFRLGYAAARISGLLEAGGSAEVVRTFGFPAPSSPHGVGIAASPSHNTDYHSSGLLQQAVPLKDRSILEDVIADAEGFAHAVQTNKDRGQAQVPYGFTDAIRSIALDENIVAMVDTIFGGEPWVVWGPNIQTGTPNAADGWHTDIESWFWPSITVVVGLSGCSDENTTRCIPGSQRLNAQPDIAGDRFDEERVYAIAHLMDPRCGPISQFQGFGDGMFYGFDAKVWHRGEPGGSAGRTVLFLHYQRARDRRIPMMEDHELGTWLDVPAPYLPGPGAEAVLERSLQQIPDRQRPKRQTPKGFIRRLVRRIIRG